MAPRAKRQKLEGGDLRSCFQAAAAAGATSEANRPEGEFPEIDFATWSAKVVGESRSYYSKRKDKWWQELFESVLRCKKHPRVQDFERQEGVDSSSFYWTANPKELVQKFDAYVTQLEGAAPASAEPCATAPDVVSSGDDGQAEPVADAAVAATLVDPMDTVAMAELLPATIPGVPEIEGQAAEVTIKQEKVDKEDKMEIEIVKEKDDQIPVEQAGPIAGPLGQDVSDDTGKAEPEEQKEDTKVNDPPCGTLDQDVSDDKGKAEQEEQKESEATKVNDPPCGTLEQDVSDDKGKAEHEEQKESEATKVNDPPCGTLDQDVSDDKGEAEHEEQKESEATKVNDPPCGTLDQDVSDDKGEAEQKEDAKVDSDADAAMKLAECATPTPCPVLEACLFAERRVAANIENTIAIKHGNIPVLHPEWPDSSAIIDNDDDFDPLWFRGGEISETSVMIPPKIDCAARKAKTKPAIKKEPGSSSKALSKLEPDDTGRESFLGFLAVSPFSPYNEVCVKLHKL